MFKSNILDHENDDMLPQYGDIRDKPCSIKPEYYVTMQIKIRVAFIRKSAAGSNMYIS